MLGRGHGWRGNRQEDSPLSPLSVPSPLQQPGPGPSLCGTELGELSPGRLHGAPQDPQRQATWASVCADLASRPGAISCCGTLGKSLNLSEPQLLPCSRVHTLATGGGDDTSKCSTRCTSRHAEAVNSILSIRAPKSYSRPRCWGHWVPLAILSHKPEPQGMWRMLPRLLVKLGQSSILLPTTRLCPVGQVETAHGSGKVGKVATWWSEGPPA